MITQQYYVCINEDYRLKMKNNDSLFLWGARQVGKTTLLEQLFPQARYYDLLKANEFERLLRQPSLLNEELEFNWLSYSRVYFNIETPCYSDS